MSDGENVMTSIEGAVRQLADDAHELHRLVAPSDVTSDTWDLILRLSRHHDTLHAPLVGAITQARELFAASEKLISAQAATIRSLRDVLEANQKIAELEARNRP